MYELSIGLYMWYVRNRFMLYTLDILFFRFQCRTLDNSFFKKLGSVLLNIVAFTNGILSLKNKQTDQKQRRKIISISSKARETDLDETHLVL